MKNLQAIIAIIGIICAFALFCVSAGLFAYVAVFGFRADWFQVFVLCILGLTAWASWNTLGMVAEWGTKNA
jgi:hypothetical protein